MLAAGHIWAVSPNRHQDQGVVRSRPRTPVERWRKVFCHYVNLELSDLVLDLIEWAEREIGDRLLANHVYADLLASLHASGAAPSAEVGLTEARRALFARARTSKRRINNTVDVADQIRLSMLGSPVQALVNEIQKLPLFRDKRLFFLIDEYENLDDYQQEYSILLSRMCGAVAHSRSGSSLWAGGPVLERLAEPRRFRAQPTTPGLT